MLGQEGKKWFWLMFNVIPKNIFFNYIIAAGKCWFAGLPWFNSTKSTLPATATQFGAGYPRNTFIPRSAWTANKKTRKSREQPMLFHTLKEGRGKRLWWCGWAGECCWFMDLSHQEHQSSTAKWRRPQVDNMRSPLKTDDNTTRKPPQYLTCT